MNASHREQIDVRTCSANEFELLSQMVLWGTNSHNHPQFLEPRAQLCIGILGINIVRAVLKTLIIFFISFL